MTELDGCSLVIIRQRSGMFGGFDIIESGELTYDGDTLTFESDRDADPRVVTEEEQRQILTVNEHTQIPECVGYRLFILEQPTDNTLR